MDNRKQHIESVDPAYQDFRKLFEENYKLLVVYGLRFVTDEHKVEEIVQDSFVKLWQQWDAMRDHRAARAWLYTVTRNSCLNYKKSFLAKPSIIPTIEDHMGEFSESHLSTMIFSEILSELHTHIGNLPPRCSVIFSKLYVEGRTIHEVASELRLSLNTVKSQKDRGLKLLRTALRVAPVLFSYFF